MYWNLQEESNFVFVLHCQAIMYFNSALRTTNQKVGLKNEIVSQD